MRRLVLAAAAIACWLLLVLAWGAGIRPGTPWRPAMVQDLDTRNLTSISGTASATSAGLRVTDLGAIHQGLQSWHFRPAIDAGAMHVLRYRTEGFPRTLELALIFRTRERPNDVTAITLPWPDGDVATYDLRAVPAWQGQVIELGFSEYPLPGQAPPDIAFAPFVLRHARIQSASTSGSLQALATRWTAWTPWSMHSINVHRSDTPFDHRATPTLMLALALAGSLLLLAAMGLLRSRGARTVLLAAGLVWLLLDAFWLSQLQRNHVLAGELFQGRPWAERKHVISDRPLLQSTRQVRKVLAQQRSGTHVLYWIPGEVRAARLGYFLRPFNVARLPAGLPATGVRDGTLLLVNNLDGSWRWDAGSNRLSHDKRSFPGDLLWNDGSWLLLSVRAGAGS